MAACVLKRNKRLKDRTGSAITRSACKHRWNINIWMNPGKEPRSPAAVGTDRLVPHQPAGEQEPATGAAPRLPSGVRGGGGRNVAVNVLCFLTLMFCKQRADKGAFERQVCSKHSSEIINSSVFTRTCVFGERQQPQTTIERRDASC